MSLAGPSVKPHEGPFRDAIAHQSPQKQDSPSCTLIRCAVWIPCCKALKCLPAEQLAHELLCCVHRAEDVARVRALALQARFLRAEAMTLHQAGDYSAAVACLLRPPR